MSLSDLQCTYLLNNINANTDPIRAIVLAVGGPFAFFGALFVKDASYALELLQPLTVLVEERTGFVSLSSLVRSIRAFVN